MNYQEAMAFVGQFSRSGARVTHLDRMAGLLKTLGNPQEDFPFVHIAGTNGKGSVAEYLTQILTAAGVRAGTFTSPHLTAYDERIRVMGAPVEEALLAECCEKVKAAVREGAGYSQFEITLAIGLCCFREKKVELVLLEAGIGGLLDATNVIPPPLAAAVTAVSYDHREILGNTLPEIAAQKAGILKPGCDAVIAPQRHEAAEKVLLEAAKEKGCRVHRLRREDAQIRACRMEGNLFTYEGETYQTAMGGAHQVDNAMTAVCIARILEEKGFALPQEAVRGGIACARLPARIQVVQKAPVTVLDGAHNLDGIAALTDMLEESGTKAWIGICGMTDSKDADTAAFLLDTQLRCVLCVDGFSENSLPAPRLRDAFLRQHAAAQTCALTEALSRAESMARATGGGVVICGSLYLAGWYLQQEGERWKLS